MFNFLIDINSLLVPIKNDIDTSIKMKSGIVYVAVQTFCECIMKYINIRENFIDDEDITLGTFLFDNEFKKFITDEIGYGEMWLFDEVNLGANNYKHYAFSQFSYDRCRKIYKSLYFFSVKVYNYYAEQKIPQDYDKRFIENLLEYYKPEEEEYELFNLNSQKKCDFAKEEIQLENEFITIEDNKIKVRGIFNEI